MALNLDDNNTSEQLFFCLYFEGAIPTIPRMKQFISRSSGISFLITFCIVLFPQSTFAMRPVAQSPIVITEMQPGTAASGSQEFIELYNQSARVIDLDADMWRVQITSSKATTWERAKNVMLTGKFYPGTYLLLASDYVASGETKQYLEDYASKHFSAGLTASAGHIRIVHDSSMAVSDVLEWSTKDSTGATMTSGIDNSTPYVLRGALQPADSIKRLTDENHIFNMYDEIQRNFALSACPSPTANNIPPASSQSSLPEPLATSIDIDDPLCDATEGDPDDGLHPPSDEPPSVLLPGESPDSPGSAANNPTLPSADIGLAWPQLDEILPNPGSPRSDSTDEFIELYNSNSMPFDLSGFILQIGTTGKQYIFPAGTQLAPASFTAFFSAATHISLSNSGGQVVLLDPVGNRLSQTDVYSTAKDDQSWTLSNGKWQWTTQATPNAANKVIAPAVKASKTVKTATQKSTAKAKAAKNNKTPAATADMVSANKVEQTSPLHPLVLAVVGGFALLYGGYEYRHDLANRFQQFRSNRAARRKDR